MSGKEGPRIARINDIPNRPDLSKAKRINPRDLSNALRSNHGIEPERETKIYDSYVDEIIQTIGKDVSDQMFEQAKEIIYRKAIELQLEGNENINVSEDELTEYIKEMDRVLSENENDDNTSIKINKVPGPKRKKK